MSKRRITRPNAHLCSDFPICAIQFLLYLSPLSRRLPGVCRNYMDIRKMSIVGHVIISVAVMIARTINCYTCSSIPLLLLTFSSWKPNMKFHDIFLSFFLHFSLTYTVTHMRMLSTHLSLAWNTFISNTKNCSSFILKLIGLETPKLTKLHVVEKSFWKATTIESIVSQAFFSITLCMHALL